MDSEEISKLSDKELLALKKKLESDISKYQNMQLAKKTQSNSAYGACGSEYFRYFDIRLAEAITVSGQFTIRYIMQSLNKYINGILKTDKDYVIAGDTDSVYLNLEDLVEAVIGSKNPTVKQRIEFMDKVCSMKLSKVIASAAKEIAESMNMLEQRLSMKREVLAEVGVWTRKKRYILLVHNTEGAEHAEPKIKITGMESKKSSTPRLCRKWLKDAYSIILQKDEAAIQEFIKKCEAEFFALPPEQIATPISVKNIDKFESGNSWVSGTPFNSKSTIVYNKLLRDNKLTKKYRTIKEGEKVKIVPLKMPNPVKTNNIAFVDVLPEEFKLNKYVDYRTHFDKVFLTPLRVILHMIGWTDKPRADLSAFFED